MNSGEDTQHPKDFSSENQRVACKTVNALVPAQSGCKVHLVSATESSISIDSPVEPTQPILRTPNGKRWKEPSSRDQSVESNREWPALAARWRQRVRSEHSLLILHVEQMSPGPKSQIRASATPAVSTKPATIILRT